MKLLRRISIVLLISLLLCGCQEDIFLETLPSLAIIEYDTISFDDEQYVYGVITQKMHPNVLVLKPSTKKQIETWGETVYIITEDADEWCVDDEINVIFTSAERPFDKGEYLRIVADEVRVLQMVAKPIIYFYPEVPTVCQATLDITYGELTCTYPEYTADGWSGFTAYPDGTLIFPNGKRYYALYWEGVQNVDWDFSQGFCVRGEDTAGFLEWALAEQGLSQREANEFIIYWLPLMQNNAYNVISFQNVRYTESALLDISPSPESMLRIFMAYYPSDTEIEIPPQEFDTFTRKGFTVVEWGGSQVSKSE